MIRALKEYHLTGVKTTIAFCLAVMENKNFQNGDFDTHFVDQEFHSAYLQETGQHMEPTIAVGALLYHLRSSHQHNVAPCPESSTENNPWKMQGRRQNLERLST